MFCHFADRKKALNSRLSSSSSSSSSSKGSGIETGNGLGEGKGSENKSVTDEAVEGGAEVVGATEQEKELANDLAQITYVPAMLSCHFPPPFNVAETTTTPQSVVLALSKGCIDKDVEQVKPDKVISLMSLINLINPLR